MSGRANHGVTMIMVPPRSICRDTRCTAAHHLFLELQRSNAILLRLIEKLTEDALVGGRIDRRPVRREKSAKGER